MFPFYVVEELACSAQNKIGRFVDKLKTHIEMATQDPEYTEDTVSDSSYPP